MKMFRLFSFAPKKTPIENYIWVETFPNKEGRQIIERIGKSDVNFGYLYGPGFAEKPDFRHLLLSKEYLLTFTVSSNGLLSGPHNSYKLFEDFDLRVMNSTCLEEVLEYAKILDKETSDKLECVFQKEYRKAKSGYEKALAKIKVENKKDLELSYKKIFERNKEC